MPALRPLVPFAFCLLAAQAVESQAPLDWRPLGEPGQGGQPVSVRVSPHDPQLVLSGGDMLGVARSLDGGESWLPAYGFSSDEMADFSWHPSDPQVVWVGSMMGPYRSEDGGQRWQAMRAGMPPLNRWKYSCPIEIVRFDPQDPNRLLAFGGNSRRWKPAEQWGGVWESLDGGAAWTLLTRITAAGSAPDAAWSEGLNIVAADYAADGTLLALADGHGVYRSTDGGRSWTRQLEGLPHGHVQRLALHPSDGQIAWLSLGATMVDGQVLPGGVYRSEDGGQSWRPSQDGLPQHRSKDPNTTASFRGLAVAPTDPSILFVSETSWSCGAIYRSRDGGASWHAVATHGAVGPETTEGPRAHLVGVHAIDVLLPPGCEMRQIEIDPSDASRIYAFNTESIVRSVDGGETWQDITAERVEGERWRGRGWWTGWVAKTVAFNPYKPQQIVIQAMDTGRAWISDDDGASWHYASRDPSPWSGGTHVAFAPDGSLLAGTGQGGRYTGLLLSRDWGASWRTLLGPEHGLPERGPQTVVTGVHIDPSDSARMWAVIGGLLYRSENGGAAWTRVGEHEGLGRLGADPTAPQRFYVAGNEGLQVWTGSDLEPIADSPKPLGGDVHVDVRGTVYVCQHRQDPGGVYRYRPEAGSWERIVEERLAKTCVSDPHDPDRLVIGTAENPFHDHAGALGIWISSDAGASWHDATGNLPTGRVTTVGFDPHRPGVLAIGTGGRGFFRSEWPLE